MLDVLTVRAGRSRTTSVNGEETPPPGAGVKTVTFEVPGTARSLAPIDACSWVALTKVVGRLVPFQRTTEPASNLLPLIVSVRAELPATIEVGDSVVTSGIGSNDASTVIAGLVATRVLTP